MDSVPRTCNPVNKYPQHMFSWRDKKTVYIFWLKKKASSLEQWFLFQSSADKSGNVKINVASEPPLSATPVKTDEQSIGGEREKTPVEELSDPMTTTIRTEFGVEKISFQPKISIRKSKLLPYLP